MKKFKFKHRDYGDEYYAKLIGDEYEVSWEWKGKIEKVKYDKKTTLRSIKKGTWVMINEEIEAEDF